MRANFKCRRVARMVFARTVLAGLLFFSFNGMAATLQSNLEPAVVLLPPGVNETEIQSALDALPDAGGQVVLPRGTIEITQPIFLRRDSQTLRGTGAETILQLADKANCPVVIMGEPVNHPQTTVKNLCVRDLFIDGNRRAQTRELWKTRGEGSQIRNNGITVQAVSDSKVENVTCARCRSGGLVTTLGVRRLWVQNLNSFDNQFDGLACYSTENSTFTGLFLHDNPGAGISLDLGFNHNCISNAILTANDLGIFMRASSNNRFDNVSIHASRNHGVFMAHTDRKTADGWNAAPQTECVRNSFTNLAASNCGGAAFRINNSTCTNNTIIRPNFSDNLNGNLSLAEPDLVVIK
jgi:hypothetical protein